MSVLRSLSHTLYTSPPVQETHLNLYGVAGQAGKMLADGGKTDVKLFAALHGSLRNECQPSHMRVVCERVIICC